MAWCPWAARQAMALVLVRRRARGTGLLLVRRVVVLMVRA
jgi:hypothetical protein